MKIIVFLQHSVLFCVFWPDFSESVGVLLQNDARGSVFWNSSPDSMESAESPEVVSRSAVQVSPFTRARWSGWRESKQTPSNDNIIRWCGHMIYWYDCADDIGYVLLIHEDDTIGGDTDKTSLRLIGTLLGGGGASLGVTLSNLVSLYLTCPHAASLGFAWFHLLALDLTWSHLALLVSLVLACLSWSAFG